MSPCALSLSILTPNQRKSVTLPATTIDVTGKNLQVASQGCQGHEQANLALLPAELIYAIEHLIDDDDALAARLTCRRMRATLTSDEIPRQIADPVAKDDLRYRLVADAIADENEGETHPGLMQVCEGCVCFHAKDI
ncbi:hypothetical protein BKA80DRAFT_308600 [Phyllosticta citrichinensis]